MEKYEKQKLIEDLINRELGTSYCWDNELLYRGDPVTERSTIHELRVVEKILKILAS